MDQLSSCYFCGGALDVSLSEYPVVPTELRAESEDSKTVVLCTTCRKKLATVVEEVVAATESESEMDESEFEPITTSESDADEDESAFEPIATDDSEASDTDESSLFEDESGSEEIDEGGSGLLGDDSSSERAATDETTTEETTRNRTTSNEKTSDTSSSSDAAGESEDDGPTLTRLEYNKVMRLLKNREFPVDRMEIREVATSAYQISPEEFDAVIDAAIERDLIAERNGKFVDPE